MLKKKINRAAERLMRLADFPIEAAGDVPTVEIKGEHELYVTGCESILELESERIVIKTKRQTIYIIGEELEISEFLASGICATGKVNEVRFARDV